MTTLMQEKQRLSERLERLAAEREALSAQLNELEVAERVVARLGGKAATTGQRSRGHAANIASPSSEKRGARGNGKMPRVSLSDATLRAVQAHDGGVTAGEILQYISRELGMTVRPNHLGMALQRHRRAGRLDNRNKRWHLTPSA